MKTNVTAFRACLALVFVALGSMTYATVRLTAAQKPEEEESFLQCWRWVWEPIDACTFCWRECFGAGYICCQAEEF